MSEYAKPIDITSSPDLQRLAEQVKQTRTPVELTRDDEVLAVVRPAPPSRSSRLDTAQRPRRLGPVAERTFGALGSSLPALTPQKEHESFEEGVAEEVQGETPGSTQHRR